jgi:ribosome modulation factor
MRPMGENEKARALGYLDGCSGRPKDDTIPAAQSRAYFLGYADGVACRVKDI